MSKQVEPAMALVVTEVEKKVSMTAGEQSPVVNKALVAQLVGEAQRQGLCVEGEDGLLGQLTKLVLESALDGEITAHLGYDKHERTEDAVRPRKPAGGSARMTSMCGRLRCLRQGYGIRADHRAKLGHK